MFKNCILKFEPTRWGISNSFFFMPSLPPVGSPDLLDCLSDYVPDELIAGLLPRRKGRGRRADFSSIQLFRILLLSVVTPARSFNLLCRLLPENRAWRRFSFLPSKCSTPGPRILHEFRQKLPPKILRAINAHLLAPLLDQLGASTSVALIDATDLRAATNAYKKTAPGNFPRIGQPWVGAV